MKKEKCLSTINLSYPDAKVRIGFGTYSAKTEVAKVSQGLSLHLSS
jgi:hypothetical protein